MARARTSFVLLPADSGERWSLGVVTGGIVRLVEVEASGEPAPGVPPGELGATSWAERIALALHGQGYDGAGTVLALPSAWCLATPVRTDKLPRKHRRDALIYRLEAQLPLPAEQFVCDFAESGHRVGSLSPRALGVAARLAQVQPLVRALESLKLAVQHVCPAALLTVSGLLQDVPDPPDVVVFVLGQNLELVLLDLGLPASWSSLPADDADGLLLKVDSWALHRRQPLRLGTRGALPQAVMDALAQSSDASITSLDGAEPGSVEECACRASDALLRGRSARQVLDLRRGALAAEQPLRQVARPLIAAAASMLLALLTITGVSAWRAAGYGRLAEDLRLQQAAVFGQLLPGQPVPEAVLLRLASEHRKLQAISGGPASSELPGTPSALALLYDLLAALPQDLRFRLLEVKLGDGQVTLDGQARSHADADAVAAALRAARGAWLVDPPRTEQLKDGGISFTLHATTAPPGAVAQGGMP
jgi:hypothetical protein